MSGTARGAVPAGRPVAHGPSGGSATRTAVLTAPRRFEILETFVPEPGPGQVRVAVDGCGVCGSDLAVWRGAPWFDYPRSPGTPGHEVWGRVEAVGPGVPALRAGDSVACLGTAGFTSRALLSAREVVRMPKAVAATPFPAEPVACALGVIARSRVRRGHDVAIVGGGFLGCLLTKLAVRRGARVTVLSPRPTSRRAALACGASAALPADGSDGLEEALSIPATDAGGFDVVIEAAGRQAALDLATRLTRTGGRLVIAGYHQDGPRTVDMQLWNWRGLDVVNAHERELDVRMCAMREAIRLAERDLIDVAPLVTHVLPLDDVAAAFALLEHRPEGFIKAVVVP